MDILHTTAVIHRRYIQYESQFVTALRWANTNTKNAAPLCSPSTIEQLLARTALGKQLTSLLQLAAGTASKQPVGEQMSELQKYPSPKTPATEIELNTPL